MGREQEVHNQAWQAVPAGKAPPAALDPQTWRQAAHLFLECPELSGRVSKLVSQLMLVVIAVSVLGFILETVPSLASSLWRMIEIGSTIVFTLEWLCRVAVCDAFGDQTRLEFMRKPMNILDLMAVLPWYLEWVLQGVRGPRALSVFRAIRLIRCFRIVRLGKYSKGMDLMVEALLLSIHPLTILMFFLLIGVVFFSSLMYFAERIGCLSVDVKAMITAGTFEEYAMECDALDTGWSSTGRLCCTKHGAARDFQSIPGSIWWAVVTMTTVGFGDKYPRTPAGCIIGTGAMLAGILLISLPVAIVGSHFQHAYEKSLQQEALEQSQSLVPSDRCASEASAEQGDSHAVQSCVTGRGSPNLHRLDELRCKVSRLSGAPKLTERAQDKIGNCLELFDHIERVERLLSEYRAHDLEFDCEIRSSFSDVMGEFDRKIRLQHGTNRSVPDSLQHQDQRAEER